MHLVLLQLQRAGCWTLRGQVSVAAAAGNHNNNSNKKHLARLTFVSCKFLSLSPSRTDTKTSQTQACCMLSTLNRTHTHTIIASARLERISFFVSGRHVQASDFSVRRNSNYIYTLCDNYPLEGKLSVMREMRGSDFRVVFITGNAPLECQWFSFLLPTSVWPSSTAQLS